MRRSIVLSAALSSLVVVGAARAQDKVPLEPPSAAAKPAASADALPDLKGMPDGILRVKSNPDGSFKSLVVKATVEIDDVLGADKGKRQARGDAEMQCKKELTRWLQENCQFAESRDTSTQIVTKGDTTKDAAGNAVRLKSQQGVEVKTVHEYSESYAKACLQGLITLQSEVTDAATPEYVLVMGLSQQTLNQSSAVRSALTAAAQAGTAAGADATPAAKPPADNPDRPTPETKTNPDAKDF